MFDDQRNALAVSKTPWLSMEGARNLTDGDVFDFPGQNMTGEDLSVFLSASPGTAVLAVLPVAVTVSATTWFDYLTPCRLDRYLPCGVSMSDAIAVTSVGISWGVNSFVDVPEASVPNGVLPLYLELRRTDGTGPRVAGGVFYLTETNLNGN